MSFQNLMHEINGLRVNPMTKEEIKKRALPIAEHLGFTEKGRRRLALDGILEKLSTIINLEVFSTQEWQELTHDLTKGHFSPGELTIRIPEIIYEAACKGERDGLEVVLHELGHAFLAHHVTLHKAIDPPTEQENAEWQADTFADIILEAMGYYRAPKQLSLDFGKEE